MIINMPVTYAEAYDLLALSLDNVDIEYQGHKCFIKGGLICYQNIEENIQIRLPFRANLFHVMSVQNDFEAWPHEDIVSFTLYGLTVYQEKVSSNSYKVNNGGYVIDSGNNCIGRVRYTGDVNLSGVTVTVDSAGGVDMKNTLEMYKIDEKGDGYEYN